MKMSKAYEKDELGCRMKTYENVSKPFLTLGIPHVIRLDMRAGHSFCRKLKRPFDEIFSKSMEKTAIALCEQIPGVKFAYTQSDEISLALNDDFGNIEFQCFFDGIIEKIVSISASIATLEFNKAWIEIVNETWGNEFYEDERILELNPDVKVYRNNFFKAQFDSRVFSVPNVTELHNYFLWRQQDATKNSILSVGYANFSQKEMDGKNCEQIQDMLHAIGINWNDFPVKYKRGIIVVKEAYEKEIKMSLNGKFSSSGTCIRHRWTSDKEIPILSQETSYVKELFEAQKKKL
jgi:tRNA(His) 5'-end guanylyltransferase